MTRRLHAEVRAGVLLPGALPRAAVLVLAGSAFLLVPLPAAVLALALGVVAAVLPASLAAWGVAAVVGLGQLTHPAAIGDPRSYVALAVVHLLHVCAGLALAVDVRGRLQARALQRPLRRWLLIQVPAQLVLVAVLAVPRPPALDGGVFAIAAVVCAGAAVIVAAVLAVPRR